MSDKRTTPATLRGIARAFGALKEAPGDTITAQALYTVGAELLAEWQETNRLLAHLVAGIQGVEMNTRSNL